MHARYRMVVPIQALELVGSYGYAYQAEAERVMNIGIPLAQMIKSEYVSRVTEKGRSSMAASLDALNAMAETLGSMSQTVKDGNPTISMSELWGRIDVV